MLSPKVWRNLKETLLLYLFYYLTKISLIKYFKIPYDDFLAKFIF